MRNEKTKKRIQLFILIILLLGCFLLSGNSQAAVRKEFNYQGKLTDVDGLAVSDGAYDVIFNIYTQAGGGTAVWTEGWTSAALFTDAGTTVTVNGCATDIDKIAYTSNTNESSLVAGQTLWNTTKKQSAVIESVATASNYICVYAPASAWASGDAVTNRVYVKNGLFSVMVGSVAAQTVDFTGNNYYLGVTVGSDSEMIPRKKIGSVPQAWNANNLSGDGIIDIDNTSVVRDAGNIYYNPASGNYNALSVAYGTAGGTGTALTVTQSGTGAIVSLANTASATADAFSLSNLGSGKSFIVNDEATDTTPFVIDASGNVGIGTTTPSEKLEVVGKLKIGNDTISGENITFDGSTEAAMRVTNANGYISISPINAWWAHIYTDRDKFIFNKPIYSMLGRFSSYSGTNLILQRDGVTKITASTTAVTVADALQISGAGDSYFTGHLGIGTTSPTAVLHLKAGTTTAGTAPLKFTSGDLMTTAEVGAIEFLNDAYYGTITTGTARRQFAFTNSNITGNAANVTGTVTVAHGGTGLTALTQNGILYGNGTSNMGVTGAGANNNILYSNNGTPAWTNTPTILGTNITSLNADNISTGTLVVSRGGTGSTTLTGVIKGNGTSAMTAMTGTSGYLTRWTDANTLGTGVIYDDGTNVGIGTTSPGEKLTINGNISATGVIRSVTVQCTTDTAIDTVAKTVTIAGYTLTAGDLLSVKFTDGNSVSSPTLNVNGIGDINIRLGNTNVTTTNFTLAAGSTVLMYYDGTYFQIMGSQRLTDSNSNYYDRMYHNTSKRMGADLTQYKIIAEGSDGKFYPLTVGDMTSGTKTVSAQTFKLNGLILYYNSTTAIAAEGLVSNTYTEINMSQMLYTFNSTITNSYQPIYLVGTVDSSGYLVLTDAGISGGTGFYTDTLPTSDDGKVYIYLGQIYNTNYLRLSSSHPIYEYKKGMVREYNSGYGVFLEKAGDTMTGNLTMPAESFIGPSASSGIYFKSGNLGIGTASPTAVLTLKAGTATANTAPLKFTSGTSLTAPEAGAMEYDGTNLYFTPSTARKTIAFTDSNITGTATNVTGTVAVANGGTGATTLTGVIKGNGTSAMTAMTGTTGYNAYWSDANTIAAEQYTSVTRGGTGAGTFTANGILYGNGTSALSVTAAGTANYILYASTGGVPAWTNAPTISGANITSLNAGNISSGILSVARGGTGTGTGSITGTTALTFTAGGTNQNVILTPSGTGYTLLNGNVGIGTESPGSYKLSVNGSAYINNTVTASRAFVSGTSTSWGVTNGANTGGVNVSMGNSSSATWLISSTSDGTFRAGIQALDSNGSLRVYSNGDYMSINGSTISNSIWNGSTIGVAYGGTGATTLTGVIKGNGTSAMTAMTGTSGYLTRWTDANTLGTGVIYDNGTNVGIGTTSPLSKLHVRKAAIANFDKDDYATAILEDTEGRLEFVSSDGGSNGATLILTDAVGAGDNRKWFFGTGTSTDSNKLHIGYSTDLSNVNPVASSMLVLTTAGNVGIGTAAPGEALEVNGNIKTTVDRSLPHIVLDSSSSGDNWSGQGAYISIGKGGALGSAAMHITYVGDGYGYAGAGTVTNGIPGGGYWRYSYNSSRVYTPSNVSIGTTSSTAVLTLKAGTATANTAPLKFTSGISLTTPEAGAVEYDGTQLYFSPSTTRNILAQISGSTALTAGSVPFATTNGYLSENNANFFWDNVNARLGIGTNAPGSRLEILHNASTAALTVNQSGAGDIMDILDSSISIFKIGQATVDVTRPLDLQVEGDVGVEYNLRFLNNTASYITSSGPLIISAGDSNSYENLTLTTSGTGDVVIDIASSTLGFRVVGAAGKVFSIDPSGNVVIGGADSGDGNLTVKGNISTQGGNLDLNGLAIPSGVAVAPIGTAGTTTYGYRITAINDNGETLASATATTATGNVTLSSTNYNRITWTAVEGATGYKVYGRASGSELYMATVNSPTLYYNDTLAVATPAGALPTLNTTGGNNITYASTNGPKRSIILTAAGAEIPTSAGAAQTKVSGTNHAYYVLDYDAATDENAYWHWTMPDSYDGGAIDVTYYWEAAATSGTAIWCFQTVGIAANNSEDIDQALSTAVCESDAAQSNANDLASVTETQTASGFTAGEYVAFKVYRDADAAGDTMSGDARLVKVKIEYSVNAESD